MAGTDMNVKPVRERESSRRYGVLRVGKKVIKKESESCVLELRMSFSSCEVLSAAVKAETTAGVP